MNNKNDSKKQSGNKATRPEASRRNFLAKAAIGAGAAAATVVGRGKAYAGDETDSRPIKIPDE